MPNNGGPAAVIASKMEITTQAMKRPIAILLVLMVACDLPVRCDSQVPEQQPRSPSASYIEDQVRQIPLGAFIEVQFTDKSRFRGYLSVIKADGFGLKAADATTGSVRQTAFSDVKSVRVVRRTHTPAWAWVATGVIVAVVVIVVVVFAVERHNE
jgi:hypothetical protein